MKFNAQCLFLFTLFWSLHYPCIGQEQFVLSVPGSNIQSTADLSPEGLRVADQNGGITQYVRDRRFDSNDQRYLGFYSVQSQQVLQWPFDHQGSFRIGRATPGGWVYTPSKMIIQSQRPILPPQGMNPAIGPPGVGVPPRPGFAPVAQDVGYYRLATIETVNQNFYLDCSGGAAARMMPRGPEAFQTWRIIPIGGDVVRLQGLRDGISQSLLTVGPQGPIGLGFIDQSQMQLWRALPVPGQPQAVWFESVAFPGQSLTGAGDGFVTLSPFFGAPAQQWMLETLNPAQPLLPAIRVVSKVITPKAPLPPAQIDLTNSTRRELWVLLGDRRDGNATKQIRIPAADVTRISLERDSGSQLTEVYETQLPNGTVDRSEFVTDLPPSSYYDLSVYELALKSIAIDRTGKSPNAIEDVNHQPKSIGWFQLPPGDRLTSGPIDVYAQAKSQNNPGGVRPLDIKKFVPEVQQPDVLEKILDRAKRP